MDSPMKSKSGDATGVSRSGRVRKKSSKLTDFESPDEIDNRFKRKTDRPQKVHHQQHHHHHHSPMKAMKVSSPGMSEVYDDSDSYMEDDMVDVKDEPLEVEDWGGDDEVDEEEEEEDVGDRDPLQVDEDSTDITRETTNYSQAQSLYFSEKQGKKNIVMKDGQMVRRKKAQRKDKGKSRFTAYMLWAREVRPGIIQTNPNMDFSAVNKRLGELWALVSNTQKYNWKRRAKRLAAKGNQKGSIISTGKGSKGGGARSNIINKGGVRGGGTGGGRKDGGLPPLPPHPPIHKHPTTPKGCGASVASRSQVSGRPRGRAKCLCEHDPISSEAEPTADEQENEDDQSLMTDDQSLTTEDQPLNADDQDYQPCDKSSAWPVLLLASDPSMEEDDVECL